MVCFKEERYFGTRMSLRKRGTHKQMEVEQSPDPENDPHDIIEGGVKEGFYCDALTIK